MNKNKKAFTLVELIVVITIVAILGTIAFISLEGYSKSARDSKRISDIHNIKTTLELFSLNTGKYPLPDNGETVSFSGELLRTQGFVGDVVTTNLSRNLQNKPTDPLSNAEYVYSVTNVQTEYEVMSVYEGDMIVGNNLLNNSYAVNENFKPKIEGTYNQVFVKSTNFIVPTPSIINSEVLPLDFNDNPDAIDSSVITGGDNLPDIDVPRTTVQTGALDINLSVYPGTIDSNSTDQEKIDAIIAIQNAYSGTELADDDTYSALLSATSDEDLLTLADFTILNSGTPPASLTPTLPVPTNAATSILPFTDGDTNTDQVSGVVTIEAALDESDITDYVLYWGSDITTKLGGAIIVIPTASGSNVSHTFATDTVIPSGATHLLVFTANGDGEMASGVSVEIGDDISAGKDMNIVLNLAGGNQSALLGERDGYLYYLDSLVQTGTYPDYTRSKNLYKMDSSNNSTLVKEMTFNGLLTYTPSFVSASTISYFVGFDQDHGQELWKTDGTTAGTYMVKDINTGTGFSLEYDAFDSVYNNFVIDGDIFYFVADDGIHGKGLWRTDGTEAGTYLLKDIVTGGGDDRIYYLIKRGIDIYFSANNTDIWKTDGTIVGTTYVGTPSATFYRSILVNDDIYFGNYSSYGIGKLDNLDIITNLVRSPDFTPYSPYTPFYSTLTTFYDAPFLYYNCLTDDNTIARQPGTISAQRFVNCRRNMDTLANGNVFKNDIHFQSSNFPGTSFIEVGLERYMICKKYSYSTSGYTSVNGLCKKNSDSTDVSMIFNAGSTYTPAFLVVAGGELFFYSYSTTYGAELHKSDGITTGIVKDLRVGSGSGLSGKPFEFNGKIYFMGTQDGVNYSLYSY